VTRAADSGAREAIGDALDDTLVVEAAAGTGKTTELVRRIVRVLSTGRATMAGVVAVTFTEKAAGELKLRIREALERERAGQPEDVRARLDLALETLEDAHVNTIHGFCADLLRERPVEACVDPLFTVLTEQQSQRMYARAFREWLQAALERPPEGVRRALRRSSGYRAGDADDGPIDRLRAAGWTLASKRGFPAPWRRPLFDRTQEIDRLIRSLHALADLSAQASSERDNLYLDTAVIRRLSRQIGLEQSFGREDYDGWEARLVDLARDRNLTYGRKGSGYRFGSRVTRTDVLSARDALLADLRQFRQRADADLAASLQQELSGATARYEALKAAAGALDFDDLLERARDLIVTNQTVRAHLQGRFARLFVDEFQDTDPVQAEILLLLAADDAEVDRANQVRPVPGKLFIVGDPKQAIYRFRGTDVDTYWRVGRHLEGQGGRVVQLGTSYRSVPNIQRFVNAAFAPVMIANDQTLQADYAPLSPYRTRDIVQPSVVALPVPRPYMSRGSLKPSARAIEDSLPDVIGGFIEWVTDDRNGWTIVERDSDGRDVRVPIRPRHIALLFRRFTTFGEDVTRKYTAAIEARDIPHLLVGGKSFHGREEVETVLAALAAIEWPDDELSVFATLKGALFAIDDAHLLEFRHRFRALHPFRVPKELGGNSGNDLALTADPVDHLVPIADALRLIQQLHRHRNYRPVADTVSRLLDETRAHVGLILRPAGEQALANVLHVAELARQYEADGGLSFRGFLDQLSQRGAEAGEAPILEESSDGVRLMTVHKAKGLEFPVVILADMTCRLTHGEASRYQDATRGLCAIKIGGWAPHELQEFGALEVARDEAEGVRLAYVAATRARDLLVVPALGDGSWDGGWYGALNEALYPPMSRRRVAGKAPMCPAFTSKDTVLERPNDEPAGPATVCPGLHTFESGGEPYEVVWWDPGRLPLGARSAFGVRRDDLIVKDVPRHIVADGRGRYDRWRLSRADALAAGSTPSVSVKTVRETAADASDSGSAAGLTVSVSSVPRSAADERGRGAAFGLLVHAVLAAVPFDADPEWVRERAAAEARIVGAGEVDVSAAAALVSRALTHDLVVRARAAERRGVCRRETPVTTLLPDGTLVEGVVDLAFEENGVWTVVDYKTDRELESEGEAQYRRQVAIYADAIARATGQPANGVVLRL
jgi:ATP-dependent helicase/nuclease subunit A